MYKDTEIKQYAKLKYLWCVLGEGFSDESTALGVIDKVNSCFEFLNRQNRF